MKIKVGSNIRQIRQQGELSQKDMARALKISEGAYSKIERCATDPSVGRLEQIADILKVKITDFFNSAHHSPGDSFERLEKIEENIQRLSGEFEALKKTVGQLRLEKQKKPRK